MLLIATIIHQRANEPSTFTASSQSHKSALIAAPLWNKLPATFRSALMPGTISLIPRVCYPSLTIIVQVPREWLGSCITHPTDYRVWHFPCDSLEKCLSTHNPKTCNNQTRKIEKLSEERVLLWRSRSSQQNK